MVPKVFEPMKFDCILSGTIPMQDVIEQRILNFFGNVCRLPDAAVEKQIARRQLIVKTTDSHSWFMSVKKLMIKYGLPDCFGILNNPPIKLVWKRIVREAVNKYLVQL